MTFIQDKIRVLTCQKGGRGNIISWVSIGKFQSGQDYLFQKFVFTPGFTYYPTYLLLILLHFVSTRIY